MPLLFHSFINSYFVIVLFCFFFAIRGAPCNFFIIIFLGGKKAENFTLTFTHKSKGIEDFAVQRFFVVVVVVVVVSLSH